MSLYDVAMLTKVILSFQEGYFKLIEVTNSTLGIIFFRFSYGLFGLGRNAQKRNNLTIK